MRMQEHRSELAKGMMQGLTNEYFDENGNYVTPDFSGAGGMMMPGLQDLPDQWSHLQWDIPQFQTTGQVRQLNYGQLPGVDTPEFTLDRAENATYDRMKTRLDDQFNGQRQALEIKMRNQGLVPGDEAWQAQVKSLEQKANDAYQNAQNESIMAGGREAERMFGMQTGRRGMFAGELQDLGGFANQAAMNDFQQRMMAGQAGWDATRQAAEFQNAARAGSAQERYQYADYYNQIRQQQMNEYLAQRGFTLNEIQALLNNQQVGLPQFNQFSQAGRADPTQYLQAAQLQGQQAAANASADNQFMNSLIGGASNVAGMAAMGGMFSDRRLKSGIKKIGVRNGVNWYRYTIGGQQQIGVMADEVPWAAFEHPSGYLMVDYRRV
jgi:DNA-binding transcriptional MerR regulator